MACGFGPSYYPLLKIMLCCLFNVTEDVDTSDDEKDNPFEGDDALIKVFECYYFLLCLRCSVSLLSFRN